MYVTIFLCNFFSLQVFLQTHNFSSDLNHRSELFQSRDSLKVRKERLNCDLRDFLQKIIPRRTAIECILPCINFKRAQIKAAQEEEPFKKSL